MVDMDMVNMDMVDMDNDNKDNDNDNDMPCLRSLSPMSRDHLADLSRTLGLVWKPSFDPKHNSKF